MMMKIVKTTSARYSEVRIGTFGETNFCGCTLPASVFLVATGDDAGVSHMTADEADSVASELMEAATHLRKRQAEKESSDAKA